MRACHGLAAFLPVLSLAAVLAQGAISRGGDAEALLVNPGFEKGSEGWTAWHTTEGRVHTPLWRFMSPTTKRSPRWFAEGDGNYRGPRFAWGADAAVSRSGKASL